MTNNILFLIDCIKVGFLGKKPESFDNLDFKNLDWDNIKKFVVFHKLRPILAEVMRVYDVEESESNHFVTNLSKLQTLLNLSFAAETSRLLKLLQSNNVRVLPYKGNLFIHEFYNNLPVREAGDIDLLFHPDDIHRGIEILRADGYQLRESERKNGEESIIISKALDFKEIYEIPFTKNIYNLDLHWGLNYDYLPYKVNYSAFFENSNTRKMFNVEVKMPDIETMYWMLVLHHGGKEVWVKLSHLLDLLAFMKKYGDVLDWDKILDRAKEYKMLNISLLGFYFIEKHFSFSLPAVIQNRLNKHTFRGIRDIENYWSYAKHWANVSARLRFEKIMISQQDLPFSKRVYINDMLVAHAKKNPIGRKSRFIEIPERYTYLNLGYKLLSFFFRRL